MSNKNKIIKVDDKFAIYCDVDKRIETNEVMVELTKVSDLPLHLQNKVKNKSKIK